MPAHRLPGIIVPESDKGILDRPLKRTDKPPRAGGRHAGDNGRVRRQDWNVLLQGALDSVVVSEKLMQFADQRCVRPIARRSA